MRRKLKISKNLKLSKKGFTLVELMIVVAILGILVLVAVPIFSVVTKGAKEKACASNMRIIRGKIVEYMVGIASANGEPSEFKDIDVDIAYDFYEQDGEYPDFKNLFDGGKVPLCTNGNVDTQYIIVATGPNTFYIECNCEGCPNKGHKG